MPDRSQIIDMIRELSLVTTDEWAQDKLVNLVNRGLREISASYPWPWLEASDVVTLEDGVASYSLPSDFNKMLGVLRRGTKVRLMETTVSQIWDLYGDDPSSGTPVEYYLYQGNIYFHPVPTATGDLVDLHYLKRPSDMGTSADLPPWDEVWHEILVEYGLWKVLQRAEQYQKAQVHREQYFFLLHEMRRWYDDRSEDGPWQVGLPKQSLARNVPYPWLWG